MRCRVVWSMYVRECVCALSHAILVLTSILLFSPLPFAHSVSFTFKRLAVQSTREATAQHVRFCDDIFASQSTIVTRVIIIMEFHTKSWKRNRLRVPNHVVPHYWRHWLMFGLLGFIELSQYTEFEKKLTEIDYGVC